MLAYYLYVPLHPRLKLTFTLILIAVGGGLAFYSTQTEQSKEEVKKEIEEAAETALKKQDCPSLERTFYDSSYQGPLIDTHIHIASIPDGPFSERDKRDTARPLLGVNVTIADYVCMMDVENTDKVFAFFPIWDPIRQEQLEGVKQTMEEYPDRFIPFIMPPEHDDSPEGFPTVEASVLEEMLQVYPGLFKGYGEIGLYARRGGAPELPSDSERLLEIYPVVRENNLLVYVHLGEGQKESFERVLEANPDINFIWHGDQLVEYQRNGYQNLEAVEEILNTHPNAYYGVDELYGDTWLLRPEVSKEEFLEHFEDYESLLKEDLSTWQGFIERHPDQVLWGTDRGWSAPWSLDADVALTLNTYSRAFIGRLNPEVQEKFAYKNAESLLEN